MSTPAPRFLRQNTSRKLIGGVVLVVCTLSWPAPGDAVIPPVPQMDLEARSTLVAEITVMSTKDVDVEGRFLLGIGIWVDGVVDAEVTFALRGKAAVIANREPAGREMRSAVNSRSGGARAGAHTGGSLPVNIWPGRGERGQS